MTTLIKPIVGASANSWGNILNDALDSLQDQVDTINDTTVPDLETQINAVLYNVKNHGVFGNGIADDVVALQACIDAVAAAGGGLVFLPKGVYRITAALTLPSSVGLVGLGRAVSVIKGNLPHALLKSPDAATRYFYWVLRDIGFDNTTRLTAGGVGIDFTNISHAVVQNVNCTNVATGLVIDEAAYYNQFDTFQVSGAGLGVKIGGGTISTNECLFNNLRINDVTDGVTINNSTNMCFVKMAVELFTGIGVDIAATDPTQYTNFLSARFENAAGVGTGLRNRALAQATTVFGGMTAGLAGTYINDAAASELIIQVPGLANPRDRANQLMLAEGTTSRALIYAISSTVYFRNSADSGYVSIDAAAITARGTLYTTGDLTVGTLGKTLNVKEGANAKSGVATLVAGTVTVLAAVTANSRIQLTVQSLGTVTAPKAIGVTARTTTGTTSFVITSADATDTSVVAWFIVEPA